MGSWRDDGARPGAVPGRLPRPHHDRAPAGARRPGHPFALVASASGGLRRDGADVAGEHTTLPLTARPGGLFQAQSRRFPHLRAYRAFSVRELGDARSVACCAGSCW